jgi:hypothetical protein
MGRYIDDILQPGEKVLYSTGVVVQKFASLPNRVRQANF